jgi:hypothetical protein
MSLGTSPLQAMSLQFTSGEEWIAAALRTAHERESTGNLDIARRIYAAVSKVALPDSPEFKETKEKLSQLDKVITQVTSTKAEPKKKVCADIFANTPTISTP